MEKHIKPGQKVIVALRAMIASGELPDGRRIAEIPTAEALGVSRMPVRTALRALEQEGLVVKAGARGYAARGPSAVQIEGAIAVRGVLEGLAARLVAEKGLSDATRKALDRSLALGNALFEKEYLEDADLEGFYKYNVGFHDLIVDASGNPAIGIALQRNNHLPFASASALALDWHDRTREFQHLHSAHMQHIAVVDAIKAGDAKLAEMLMRDHANAATDLNSVFERLGIEAQGR